VTIPALESVNTVPPTYLGNPNDFFAGASAINVGDSVTISALTLNPTNINGGLTTLVLPNYLIASSGSSPANRYEFSMSSIRWSSSAATDLSFVAFGTFHDTAGVFSDNAASISGSFTTTGTGSVNASFTFDTPPAPNLITPEPATATLCFIGMVGIGGYLIRRHRKAPNC
jgi:hypothetical protein